MEKFTEVRIVILNSKRRNQELIFKGGFTVFPKGLTRK
jgi:hypothetical protein